MLIGEPGVGKTAIVEGLAQRIVAGEVPDTLKDKRVVALDLSGMVAGAQYRGHVGADGLSMEGTVVESGRSITWTARRIVVGRSAGL